MNELVKRMKNLQDRLIERIEYVINARFLNEIVFTTKKCSQLSEEELQQCSELFSNHYGKWGEEVESPRRPGDNIKLGVGYYRNLQRDENMYASLALDKGKVIGQAFYIRKEIEDRGYCTWVLQLVVHEKYRRKSIAKRLLYSIWGFSGDYAWGLATTNPYTVKTLERVTRRTVNVKQIAQNVGVIKELAKDITFIDDFEKRIHLKKGTAQIDTQFFVQSKDIQKRIENSYKDEWKLGELLAGHEWVAFTFKSQPFNEQTPEELEILIDQSSRSIQEVYGRMHMEKHGWAKHTEAEVDFIINALELQPEKTKVADFGCGKGRHTIEFAKRGYKVDGIDFVKSNVKYAERDLESLEVDASFICKDLRYYKTTKKYNLVVCLYDVIGSFSDDKDNMKIIKNIYRHLKKGGYAVISVMNMHITEEKSKYNTSIIDNPHRLINLPASNTMQKTGDIFNPDFYIRDTKSNLIYRKEQFLNDNHLSGEYIVRDRRYYINEIESLLKEVGFEIVQTKCVRAGRWEESLSNVDEKAKEILLIVKKNNLY